MRINEEIDALEVMGIRAITYLAVHPDRGRGGRRHPLYTVAVLMSFLATRFGTTVVYGQSRGVYEPLLLHVPAAHSDLLWSFVGGAVHGGRGDGGAHLLRVSAPPAGRPGSVRPSAVRCRTSVTAAVFVLLTITLSVYGQSGNFHLSG